jgi:PIN domain nuclease of toxin-antitoxin system
MKLLLDTHTFIWMDMASQKLSLPAKKVLQDRSNTLLLSVVSVWEMQIKLQLGKLSLQRPIAEMISSQQQVNDIEILPVTLSHVLTLPNLPLYHKDPFDRLLIAQTIAEQATLLSNDNAFANYSVRCFW